MAATRSAESNVTAIPDDVAALAASVLDEEAKRQEEETRTAEVVLPDDLLPGVGGDELRLREVVRRGGRLTIGVLFVIALADYLNNAAFQVLAPDIQRTLGLGLSGILCKRRDLRVHG